MFEIVSFYKISKLNKLKIIKKNILKETNKLDIKGLIILSPEGINGTISGSHKKIKLTITKIKNILSIDRFDIQNKFCLLYTSPSPRDLRKSRMPSSA